MKYLLLASLIFMFLSCKKPHDDIERISTIIHHGGLSEDTLQYHYNANKQISYVEKGSLTFHYVYENNRIIQRHLRQNSILLESDSISYDNAGNISRFIAHRFANGNLPEERDQADFVYQNHRLVSARSNFTDQSASHEALTTYTWANEDISKITIRSSPTDSTELMFSYSAIPNPYAAFGQQVWLLDPGFDFTRYDNLQRVAYLSSKHCVTKADWYIDGGYFAPLTVTMQTNANNNISLFAISPTDEVIVYNY